MKRRQLLIGIGASAIGTGATFGTGAFSTAKADRSVQVDVTGDADAFVALSNHEGRDAVTSGTGQDLTIDLSSGLYADGNGINDNATVRVGNGTLQSAPGSTNQGAFLVETNTGKDISVEFAPASNDLSDITVYVNADTTGDGALDTTATITDAGTGSVTVAAGGAGAVVAVEVSSSDNIGADATDPTITLTATQ